jgi:hypothetical protein
MDQIHPSLLVDQIQLTLGHISNTPAPARRHAAPSPHPSSPPRADTWRPPRFWFSDRCYSVRCRPGFLWPLTRGRAGSRARMWGEAWRWGEGMQRSKKALLRRTAAAHEQSAGAAESIQLRMQSIAQTHMKKRGETTSWWERRRRTRTCCHGARLVAPGFGSIRAGGRAALIPPPPLGLLQGATNPGSVCVLGGFRRAVAALDSEWGGGGAGSLEKGDRGGETTGGGGWG